MGGWVGVWVGGGWVGGWVAHRIIGTAQGPLHLQRDLGLSILLKTLVLEVSDKIFVNGEPISSVQCISRL